MWMGAASGQESCIANVIRICARYGNLETLEDDYGINLMPLANFALETYADDPCELFNVQYHGDSDALSRIEEQTEMKRQDKRMVEQVSELDEAIRSMTEELGRKVAVDELAERLGIGEEQIAEILKLAGEDVDN